MIETKNYNCYEYYLKATEMHGEYKQAQHMDQIITRSEFICDVEALAAYFKNELGLKPGDVYTIFLPSDIESLVGFYALNKLGVIVNFVHPLLPAERLKEYLVQFKSKGVMILDLLSVKHIKTINEVGCPALICHNSDYASPLKKAAAGAGENFLLTLYPKFSKAESYKKVMKKYKGQVVEGLKENGNDIACYLNGGGTTGKSRTIMLTSKAINELVYKMGYIDEVKIPGEECEIIVLPFFHCFGLCVAGHMVMCNAARIIPLMQFNAKLVVKLYKKNNVVGIGGIPNMFKKLYRQKGFDGPHLGNTRMMFVGGDDLSPSFLHDFNSMLDRNGTKARLRQGYGLTEVCSACCTNTNWVNKDGSIGKPLEGLNIQIWDDNCKEVPTGEVGEICISGSTTMAGYWNEEGIEKMGLYIDENGTEWVRSGDLGYKDEDGFLFFAGRKKRLIIISGYNVYPVDIENLMDTLPFIKESCAVKGKTAEGKPLVRLYASLKTKGDEEAYKAEIIKTCEENLDKFSVPREIVFLNDLPHTPLEKVDFMALEKLDK